MTAIEWIRFLIGSLFILTGIVIFFTELFGVFHFKYVLNRMHAAAMGDTLGISACLIGLMIFSGLNFTTLKLFLIVVFLWFASPVSSHVLARLEAATNEKLTEYCEIYQDVNDLERELAERSDGETLEVVEDTKKGEASVS